MYSVRAHNSEEECTFDKCSVGGSSPPGPIYYGIMERMGLEPISIL